MSWACEATLAGPFWQAEKTPSLVLCLIVSDERISLATTRPQQPFRVFKGDCSRYVPNVGGVAG